LDKSFALLFETRYFSTANEIEVLPAPDSPKKQEKHFYFLSKYLLYSIQSTCENVLCLFDVYTIKSKRKIQSLLKTVWEKTRKYKYFAFENEHYLQSKKKLFINM
jgi:hypothetical protein